MTLSACRRRVGRRGAHARGAGQRRNGSAPTAGCVRSGSRRDGSRSPRFTSSSSSSSSSSAPEAAGAAVAFRGCDGGEPEPGRENPPAGRRLPQVHGDSFSSLRCLSIPRQDALFTKSLLVSSLSLATLPRSVTSPANCHALTMEPTVSLQGTVEAALSAHRYHGIQQYPHVLIHAIPDVHCQAFLDGRSSADGWS